MRNKVGEVGRGNVVLIEQRLRHAGHVNAGLLKYIAAEGHHNTFLHGLEGHGFIGLAHGGGPASDDFDDVQVVGAEALLADEERGRAIAPEVASHGILLVVVSGIVLRDDNHGAGGFAHGKVAFHYFNGIQQRRAGRRDAHRRNFVHVQVSLHGVGSSKNGIVGRVGANHNQVNRILGKSGRSRQGHPSGRNGHGIGIFTGGRLAALPNAGALNYPLVGQAIEAGEVRVGDDCFRDVGSHMMKVHRVVLGGKF